MEEGAVGGCYGGGDGGDGDVGVEDGYVEGLGHGEARRIKYLWFVVLCCVFSFFFSGV